MRERCAWTALRHRTCNLFTATGVLPSRQDYCNSFFRGLRPRLPSLRSVVPSRHKSSYTCTFGCGSERTEICLHARALRIIFPEKPFNPALIRATACNQTGCECIVCTSNPSLMKGLFCPEIGFYKCNVCAWKALQSVAIVTLSLQTKASVASFQSKHDNKIWRSRG